MSPEAYLMFAVGISATIGIFYGLGTILKNKWWILAVILATVLLGCIITVVTILNAPAPDCSDGLICFPENFDNFMFGLFIGGGTLIAIVFGLPAAFIASRRAAKNKKK